MQPSRDDFVIAIRSAFLKKGNQQRFSLLGLLLFSLILIILGKYNFKGLDYLRIALKEFVYRTTFIVSLPEKYLGQSYQLVKNHLNLYKNYNITKDKLNELESKDYNINYIVSENKRLKKILDEVNFSTDELHIRVARDGVEETLNWVQNSKTGREYIDQIISIDKPPKKTPRNMEPVSPIYIFAGLTLKNKKPINDPATAISIDE